VARVEAVAVGVAILSGPLALLPPALVAGAIAAALHARGTRVAAFKPVVTGLDEPEAGRPADHELLGAAAGVAPDAVAPQTFGPPVSPHLAAELAGTAVDPSATIAAARDAGAPARAARRSRRGPG